MVLILYAVVLISTSGCTNVLKTIGWNEGFRVFHDSIISEGKINKGFLRDTLTPQSSLSFFLNNIYDVNIQAASPYDIGKVHLEKKFTDGFHLDTELFSMFCSKRKGVVYKWKDSSSHNYQPLFYICETDIGSDSAIKLSPTDRPNWFYLHYLSKEDISKYIQRKITQLPNFTYYVGAHGLLTISRKFLGGYTLEVDYTNTLNYPMKINFLNSHVYLGESKYLVGLGKKSSPYKNFRGEIVDFSKININPNQGAKLALEVEIDGLPFDSDFSNIKISIDSKIEDEGFTKKSHYYRYRLKM